MRSDKACWHCQHFGGWKVMHYALKPRKAYAVAKCDLENGSIPEPEFGCVRWSREPGSDDEPGCIDPAGDKYSPGVGRWMHSLK